MGKHVAIGGQDIIIVNWFRINPHYMIILKSYSSDLIRRSHSNQSDKAPSRKM